MVYDTRNNFDYDLDILIESVLTEATIQLLFDLEQRWKSDVNIIRQILSLYLVLSSTGRFTMINSLLCIRENA